MPLFTKDDLTKPSSGKIYLIGEKHNESAPRREQEKMFCLEKYKVSVNEYHRESSMKMSTSADGVITYGDDFTLRNRYALLTNFQVAAVMTQLENFYDASSEISLFRDQFVKDYKNLFLVLSGAADPEKVAAEFLNESTIPDLKLNKEIDGDVLALFADLKIQNPEIYKRTMQDMAGEMAELITCLESKQTYYNGESIALALANNLHQLDCSLAGYSYEVKDYKSEMTKVNFSREEHMLGAAISLSQEGKNMAWKIGDNHAKSIKAMIEQDPGSYPSDVIVITANDFNNDYDKFINEKLGQNQKESKGVKSRFDRLNHESQERRRPNKKEYTAVKSRFERSSDPKKLRDSVVKHVTDDRKMTGMKFKM